MKPAPNNNNGNPSSASQGKAAGLAPGTKGGLPEHAQEQLRKGEGGGGGGSNGAAGASDGRGNAGTRTVTPVTTHPLIAPGKCLALFQIRLQAYRVPDEVCRSWTSSQEGRQLANKGQSRVEQQQAGIFLSVRII